MTARWLGILVLSCTAGWQLACGSATTDDAADVPDDVRDAPDETPVEVEDDGGGCETGWTDCSGTCFDLENDPEHCGGCETVCPDGSNSVGICESGSCGFRCEPGWVDLDGDGDCETPCTPSEPPVEACDGADNDCNGLIDDGFDCVLGLTDDCETACGSTGEHFCGSGCAWTECVPPIEICDGLDQDCDGVADDGMYGVVWDVVAAEPVTGRAVLSFAPTIAEGEVGLGYVLAAGPSGVTGQAWLRRYLLISGDSEGSIDSLSDTNTARALRGASSGMAVTFAWDTGDDATAAGESTLVRAGRLGTSYEFGSAVTLDTLSTTVSTAVGVARLLGTDSAIVTWIEDAGGAPIVEVVRTADYLLPGVIHRYRSATAVLAANPDVALHDDTTLFVVWSAGSPGEIRGQRLNTSLEVQGSELGLSGTAETTSARPRTASSGDAFAVVWEEDGGTVMLTTLGADGVVRVGATELATGGVTRPVVAPDLLGGFAVAYQNATDVELIRVNADGVPQAEPLRFTGGSRPELAAIPDGGFVVAYLAGGSVRLARVGCVP